MTIKTLYLVLNDGKSEGVVFDDYADAKHAARIKKGINCYSSLAEAFDECYGDEGVKKIIKIEVDVNQ